MLGVQGPVLVIMLLVDVLTLNVVGVSPQEVVKCALFILVSGQRRTSREGRGMMSREGGHRRRLRG